MRSTSSCVTRISPGPVMALGMALIGGGILWATLGPGTRPLLELARRPVLRRRFTSSDDAVRHSGLDVTVWQSDRKRAPGHLSHQGPPLLRWALFEAAQCAARRSSPDHAYYLEVAKRLDHNRACLSLARKLCRRAHHILRELEDDALATVDDARASKEVVTAAA